MAVGLDHIIDAARRAANRVYQARFSVHADVALHREVPLLALLALPHLRVAFTAAVPGRTRRRDQRGIDHRAALEHQTLGAQQLVDRLQDLFGQLVLLQYMAEPQDGRFVGQPVIPTAQPGEVPEQRHIVQRVFHRRVRQVEPLLHEVNAQHRLHWKRRSATAAFGHERRNQRHQLRPRHYTFHVTEKLAAPRAFGRVGQAQALLLHGMDRLSQSRVPQARAQQRAIYADHP